MTEHDAFSEEFTSAMAELTGYIEETNRLEQEKARKNKKKPFGFKGKEPVPRKEADEEHRAEQDDDKKAPSETGEEEAGEREEGTELETKAEEAGSNETQDNDEDSDNKKFELVKSKGAKLSDQVTPRPRFVDASDLVPTISKECAGTAVEAMRALRNIEKDYRRYVLINIRDDGKRAITRYRTKEAALLAMHREMDVYVNEIEPKDRTREIYVDDGENEHIFKPTPKNEISEDGTLKRPSEIDNTLHRKETDNRGIVYFETKNATARWDLYDLEEAVVGD